MTRIGRIAELWRYPVKSMLGEQVSELPIASSGALGDRAWALRDVASGRIASAKKFPRLLEFRASYVVAPTPRTRGVVQIETPSGRSAHADDPDASAIVAEELGCVVRLEAVPQELERTTIDRNTVFADIPVSQMKPDWTPETMPDYFQLMTNSFLEVGPVYLLASGSLEHLRTLQGGTAVIDRLRFRPNLYIDTSPASGRFVEDDWLGTVLQIGGNLILTGFQPTLWCVTSTLAQQGMPRDPRVLKATAEFHRGCLGVYASVQLPGTARVSDRVTAIQHAPTVHA